MLVLLRHKLRIKFHLRDCILQLHDYQNMVVLPLMSLCMLLCESCSTQWDDFQIIVVYFVHGTTNAIVKKTIIRSIVVVVVALAQGGTFGESMKWPLAQ